MEERVFSAGRNSIGFPYKLKDETVHRITFLEPNSKQMLDAQKHLESNKPSASMEHATTVLKENLKCSEEGIVDKIIKEQTEDSNIYSFFADLTNLVEETKKQKKSD